MTRWTVEFDRRGKKDFLAIKDMRLARRIQDAILRLGEDPALLQKLCSIRIPSANPCG